MGRQTAIFKMAEKQKKKLEVVQTLDSDESCQTFVLHDEDHTLGNALRYMIMKNPDVDFCGYSVPHPSEHKINLRIQSRGPPAADILRRGLTELNALCEHVQNTFEGAVEEYKMNQAMQQSTDNTEPMETG